MAKPLAITWPILMLLLDAYPLRRHDIGAMIHEKLPFFAMSLGCIGLTLIAQEPSVALSAPWDQRLFNAAHATVFYLSHWLYPVNLSPYYPVENHGPEALIIVSLITLIGLYVYVRYHKQRRWLIAWLFFLIGLSPMLEISPIGSQTLADGHAYWAIIGIHILSVVLCIEVWRRLSRFRVLEIAVAAGMLFLLISLSFLTHQQSLIWRNDISLWQRAVEYAPASLKTQNNLAAAYLEAGEYQQAIEQYQLLTAMFPDYKDGHYYLADAYWRASRWDNAEQQYTYLLTLELEKQLPVVYTRLGKIARYRGVFTQAKAWAAAALKIAPDYPPALKLQQELARF